MKIFNLVYRDMTGGCAHASAQPFAERKDAQEGMRKQYDATILQWQHDVNEDRDDYQCRIDRNEAGIMEGETYAHWHIEEWDLELPATDLVVEVSGGLVQNIFATNQINKIRVDVCDEDDEGTGENDAILLEEVHGGNGWNHIY